MTGAWNNGFMSTFHLGESIEQRCYRLHPECICIGCANNRVIPEQGVRCCATACAGKSKSLTVSNCAVLKCPKFLKKEENK